MGADRIEIEGPADGDVAALKRMGCIAEIVSWRTRLFAPDTAVKILRSGLRIQYPYENRSSGWRASKWCRRGNLIHLKVKANYDGTQIDCWGISHSTMTSRREGAVRDARRYLQKLNVKIPITFVYVQFFKVKYSEFLRLADLFNPEADGVAKPKNVGSFSLNDYHPDQIGQYPEKQAYVAKIKKWAETWGRKDRTGIPW